MSEEGDVVPMEEETVPQCNSPSNDSASMDWVKVDETIDAKDTVSHQVSNLEETCEPDSSAPKEFDEYSFGSSDGDNDEVGGNNLEDDVSLGSTHFDMDVLQDCIKGSKDALGLVTGKEVVMVVGKTGVGKSTLIQGIAGKRIQTSFHSSSFSGQTATKTVFEAQDALPDFEIGHAKVSKTRSLNAFLLKDGDNEVVWVDSPGLEDTRGVEMDIATSALLSQVAKRCKSLRFVILIHCASLLEDRGNVFRSVLQFAKKFVEVFADSKYSFMFLFTHTDEITGMAKDSNNAKKRLQEEIIQIADATKDGDVLSVLDFIRKSLKKGYPFANILHPMHTDYAKLAACATSKLQGVSNLRCASTCNLTLSSALKLKDAVQNLLDRLQVALTMSSPIDLDQVLGIQQSFNYLREYVEVECVHKVARQSEEIIEDFKNALSSSIEVGFSRWIDTSADFDTGNARELHDSLLLLQGFDGKFSPEQWIQSKGDVLQKLQDEILVKASSGKRVHREFKKMLTWTAEFQCPSVYSDTCKKVMALIDEADEVVSRIDPSSLYACSDEEVSLFVEKFLVLQAFAEHLPVHQLNFERATASFHKIMTDLKNVFKSCMSQAESLSSITYFDEGIENIASQARFFESLKSVIARHEVGINSLDKAIESTLCSLERDVIAHFSSYCDDLKNGLKDTPFDPSEAKLNWMHDLCSKFSKLHAGRWREMNSSFSAVIIQMKSILYSTSGELETMSQVAKEHGILNGRRLGEEVVRFRKCKWFDSFLPEGDAFVSNCCVAIERGFQERIDEKVAELTSTASSLHEVTSTSTSAKPIIEKLHLLLPELEEIDNFVASIGESSSPSDDSNEGNDGNSEEMDQGMSIQELQAALKDHNLTTDVRKRLKDRLKRKKQRERKKQGSNDITGGSSPRLAASGSASLLASNCAAHLEDYTDSLSEQAKKVTYDWNVILEANDFDRVHSLAAKLEMIYVNALALNKVQSLEAVVRASQEIIDSILTACQRLSCLVTSELNCFGGDFHLKARILTSIKACSGLQNLGKNIPEYTEAQHQVRNLVALEAQKLESEIEETSDWDTIDKHIDAFRSAVALDNFVSHEATARLDTLRRLREKKEGQVEDYLQEMIGANNFQGVHDFLAPLAISNDQIKKQRFESYQDEIVFKLDLMIKDVKCCLDRETAADEDSLKSVAHSMSILVIAEGSLKGLLRKKLNLSSEIGHLHGKINGRLRPFLDQIFSSLKKKDFIQAANGDRQATLVVHHLDCYIKFPNQRRHKDAKRKYEHELSRVSTYAEQLFESSFKESSDLLKSLTSLKQAKESTDASMKSLSGLYDDTRKALIDKARDFITTVQGSLSEAKCYDDILPLLHSLVRLMSGPFKPHFPTDLLMECEHLYERLQKEKREHDHRLEFGEKNVEQTIELWGQVLDKLKSPAWHRLLFHKETDRASYRNQRRKLTMRVEQRLKQAHDALMSRDLCLVQECIEFLALVEEKLEKHVGGIGNDTRKLRGRCVMSFTNLCHQIKIILEAGEISRFEEKFVEYRGFVLHIPCVLSSGEGKREFALVNQMLYESFEREINILLSLLDAESFDFSSLRTKVLRLRKLGDFFADRLTLLNEELKPVVCDKWLGKVLDLCSNHFSNGRDFGKLRFCVELGVVPSAKEPEIRRAYKELARQHHPDKIGNNRSGDAGKSFRRIKEAHDELLSSKHLKTGDQSQAFDDALRGIGGRLRALSKQFMDEQRYDMTGKLLFQLPALKELDDLVVPKLKSGETQSSVCEIVKGHVDKMRIEVTTHWSERRYKDLNNSISDLKQMESRFKAYPKIFATSWNTGIVETIRSEIQSLGQEAKAYLRSHGAAKENEDEFRRLFIEMGSVLVELPLFKAFTKRVMSNILESCLDSAWGYSFLFELGLGLQKGGDSGDDESKRIAQMLVSEFSHFKEVLTMCWNEETSQKPVEDVVMQIKCEHRKSSTLIENTQIISEELINCFEAYDKNYKTLLGEYIKPEADLSDLAQKIKALAQKMQPISCDKLWSQKEKEKIPILLAGVFSLFTVLKSGASYNRIEAAAGSSSFGEKLLMKPHNIQVLTLLYMFGCGKGPQSSIESQLMQIRTGEGKSMILGAAAVMFALLFGVRVRVVCYSEYLSTRDFRLFEEVFRRFGVLEDVKYSKITAFAEDSTASKGDLRSLTESLLRGNLHMTEAASHSIDTDETDTAKKRLKSLVVGNNKKQKTDCHGGGSIFERIWGKAQDLTEKEEILLVDEVDVFFGSEFYGRTYNQVIEFKEPEVATILKRIWEAYSNGSHRLRLKDIKVMSVYKSLLKKMASFGFLLDNEILLMLSQVKKVDAVPYYLDPQNDRIGYKVMDSISYNVTFGYSTIFAYLKEANNLTDRAATLSRALVMPVSCGQFSYANISPKRILGVSGTLEAIGQYEKDVLTKYGLNKFVYVPSVYGDSNFHFDKAGDGIFVESNKSNFYHKISAEVKAATKSKRAVIVFFRDRSKLNEFVASPTYHQLGRHTSLLTEDMSSVKKEYVINQAATSGQITLGTAVFGRGTDFFCKDESVEKNGGVHIIQTFLSEEASEEVQIKGRTARQGKRGSYQMILLDSDLTGLGIQPAEKNKVPKKLWYDWLCNARLKYHEEQCQLVENNLKDAAEMDKMTHAFFDSLLAYDAPKSMDQFKCLYELIKKPPVPSLVSVDIALVIDVTGSMSPYAQSVTSMVTSLLVGQNALALKLSHNFPETEFQVHLGCVGFRDIDDGKNQFTRLKSSSGSHFTSDASEVLSFVKKNCASPSGGFDLAEDIIGAVKYCSSWRSVGDWTSDIKFMMLLTDAPAHGLLPETSGGIINADSYSVRHPEGFTTVDAVTSMISRGVDLFFCSFNPLATARTEEQLSHHFKSHPDNVAEHGVTRIPMVPTDVTASPNSSIIADHGRHIIFVLDESGSMMYSWSGVVAAYNQYISKRKQNQCDHSDLVSVVQFDNRSRITVQHQPLYKAPGELSYSGSGTAFHPAAIDACKLARGTPRSHTPTIIFMSDGQANDAAHAAMEFTALNNEICFRSNNHLELHVIAFGTGTNQAQLQHIAAASGVGRVHASSNTAELASVFVNIATTQNVSLLLESEITKRISEAVSDKLELEYFGT